MVGCVRHGGAGGGACGATQPLPVAVTTTHFHRCTRILALTFLALASGACAALLGIEERMLDEGPAVDDGSPSSMTVVDAAVPDAEEPDTDADAAPPVLACGDAATVSSCSECSSGVATCGGSCVSDCTSACDPATLGCFTCSGGVPVGICEPATTNASCIANPLYAHCPCGNAGDCPGANQVCVLNECRTCGEPLTAGEVCRDGTGKKVCKSATDPDPAKRLRCR
jgi:hypothetical protein